MTAVTSQQTERIFSQHFGTAPRWMAAAPGRINLIGEHTDYNDGFVLPLAINRHIAVAAAPAAGDRTHIFSAALNSEIQIAQSELATKGQPHWSNYVRGVIHGFAQRGMQIPPLNIAITSDIAAGGGLASSAALEVATATLIESITGQTLDPHDKARVCRQAEHDFAGVPCGIMDQLASVFGDERGALLIDCRTETHRIVPLADSSVTLLVANSNVKHALADGAYQQRREQCARAAQQLGVNSLRDATPEMIAATHWSSDDALERRARHVVSENIRTVAAASSLEARDFHSVGALMYASHDSLRDDFEVSCPELDSLVEIARETGEGGGVFGARMTGGGFGGCTINLVSTDVVSALSSKLESEYRRRTGLTATTFVARPARGAHIVQPTS